MTTDLLKKCPICDAGLPEPTAENPSEMVCPDCKHLLQNLGEFKAVRYVGRGGMGIVFEGRSSEDERVAIKIAFGNFTKQLENEREILRRASQLNAPYIASLRGSGEETVGGRSILWVATRWIGSRTLSDIMSEEKIGTKERLRILENIARGIHYLHENDIIHGDICPNNIMLTDDNEPYLGDFGVSRSLSLEDKMKTVQVTSSTAAKAKYGAPEIWDGKESGPKSDIYSFGVVALEFLTKGDFSRAKLSDVQPPLETELCKKLEKCCERDPNDRPPSMGDVCWEFVTKGRQKIISPRLATILCTLFAAIGLIIGLVLGNKFSVAEKATVIPGSVVRLAPQQPVDLKIEAPAPDRLVLTWEAPAELPQGYILQWREFDAEKWNIERFDSGTTCFEIKQGIRPETSYIVNVFSYNTAEELHSSPVSGNLRTPSPPDVVDLPPPPPPEWLKYVQVKKDGKWVKPDESDKLDGFTQWKIDGTVDQFVDRELVKLIDDIKDRLVILELSDCNYLTPHGYSKLIDARGMTDLTIRNCTGFNDEAVKELFPKLESEAVSEAGNTPGFPLGGLVDILEAVPLSPIKRLAVIQCPITDASLEHFPNALERLQLNECTKIADKGLEVIASRFGELQHLSLKKTGTTFKGIPVLLGLEWKSNPLTGWTTANIVEKGEPPLPKLRKLELDESFMEDKAWRKKLLDGLKEYRENVEITGVAH